MIVQEVAAKITKKCRSRRCDIKKCIPRALEAYWERHEVSLKKSKRAEYLQQYLQIHNLERLIIPFVAVFVRENKIPEERQVNELLSPQQ